jgi:hypothetical protein
VSASYPDDANDALSMQDGPAAAWWTSPDIWLGSTLGGSVAHQGTNLVNVRVHKGKGLTFAASQARFDVYVGNPSLVMTPTAGTRLIGQPLIANAVIPDGGAASTSFNWTVTLDADPTHASYPDQPGHRCLIARVYPFGSARPSTFNVLGEQHEAQLNILIAETAKDGAEIGGAGAGMAGAGGRGEQAAPPIGPGRDGLTGFLVDTTTLTAEREPVVIHAMQPERLSGRRTKTLMRALAEHDFEGFVEGGVPFDLDFDVPKQYLPNLRYEPRPGDCECDVDVEIVESDPFIPEVKQLDRGKFEAVLEPQRIARFALKADMSAVDRGYAAVFEIKQLGGGGDEQGGLTLVMLQT